ncbi:hypothetical protein C8Q80DRAFT_1215541 [Daedaleopsis nitida]|nr:hypothetical protein C8Q80DRAFT_1215541 [Daedaleopsis nitida]
MADSDLDADAILADIQCESLQSFLTTVRRETTPAGSTSIPALDAHLSSVNTRRTSRNWPLNLGDVLEVQGPAASGKTHFLYHMLVHCLLPRTHQHRELGGWGKAAVVFDTDGKLSIPRLHRLLVSRLCRLLAYDDAIEQSIAAEDLAAECLNHLHVFQPTSSLQLAITLLHLPRYLATDSRLEDKEIGLLSVDSLSAFYWRDRYTLEQLRDAADSSTQSLPPNPLYHVVKALQGFRVSHRPVVLLTNWGLNALTKPAAPTSLFYRQHLYPFPAPFEPHGAEEAIANIQSSQGGSAKTSAARAPRFIDTTMPLHYHITLHPSPIDPFPRSYSLADAADQEHMRAVLVNKGEVRGIIRTPGDETVGVFTFRIGEDEILVHSEAES